MSIPTVTELSSAYDDAAAADVRFTALRKAFDKEFGHEPELFSRAPGRVNLIGEHIDYEGYSVLPMAIKHDTVVAIGKGGTKLRVSNLEGEKYPTREFGTDPAQEVDTANHSWANYFVCAYKGVFELLDAKGIARPEPVGLEVMLHGVVPTGSGLSSSAAFVCSCSLAILGAYGITVEKADVAEWSAKAERYVGVSSGGMDQAISLMAMRGVAMRIDFNPVRASDVVLPEGATFVVAHSLAVSNKAEGAYKRYNLRVVECRLAAAVLALALGASKDTAAKEIKTLQDCEPLVAERHGSPGLDTCATAVKEHLHAGLYTHAEIEGLLGTRLEAMYEGSPVSLKVVAVAREAGGFKLHDRALHVYEEAARVHAFKDVCDGSDPGPTKLERLGKLMDSSHTSCSQLYECSCPELDKLTDLAREAGALGSRLTGAGWGGCTVSLVEEGKVASFLEQLREKYYKPLVDAGVTKEDALPDVLFATKPSSGAALLKLPALVPA